MTATETILGPGRRINGRYLVQAILGRGGMGVVYGVDDPLHPERAVALKTIGGLMKSPVQLELFKAEFRTMARLRHPNLAQVFDFEAMQGSGDHFFTMERIRGRDALAATDGASWQTIVDIVVQISRALSYLHSRGIIHSDVKPQNIVVTDDGIAKLLDFGIARSVGERTGRRGSRFFMAPELVGGGELDHRADLYGLGATAYALLHRHPPGWVSDTSATVDMPERSTATPSVELPAAVRAAIPEWLSALVEKLCTADPERRPESANAVIEAVNRGGGRNYELETSETAQSYLDASAFIGRAAELDALIAHVAGRMERRPDRVPALLVAGPSGVGKSRLLREVKHECQLRRILFLEGNCYEGALSGFGPLIEAVRQLVTFMRGLGADELLSGLTDALSRIDPELELPGKKQDVVRHDQEPQRLLDQLSEFFVRCSKRAPFVLYVNDMQWMPSPTAQVLRSLLATLRQRESHGEPMQLTVLGSYRDDEVSGRPLSLLLAQLTDMRAVERLTLSSLPPKDVGALLSSMLGVDVPDAFVQRVASETAGNPFFVQETMRALLENGVVSLRDGRWTAQQDIGVLEIPASVAAVFRRRVALVTESQRAVLDLLALHARPMSLAVLAEATGLRVEETAAQVGMLHERQMLAAEIEATYSIAHDRMRETLEADIVPERKREFHRRLGEAIERVHADMLEAHLYELAFHFRRAGVRDKAFTYCLQAADRARRSYANQQAAELYAHAQTLMPDEMREGSVARAIVEHLADLSALTGAYPEALHGYRSLLPGTVDPMERARLHQRVGNVHFQRAELVEAAEELWKAVELLGDSGYRSRATHVLKTLGAALMHLQQRARPPRPLSDDAPARERHVQLSRTYRLLGYVYFHMQPKLALYPILKNQLSAEHLGPSPELSHACSFTGVIYGAFGVPTSGRRYAARALSAARGLDSSWHLAQAHSFNGILRYLLAEWREAESYFEESIQGFQRCGDMYELSLGYYHLAECKYFQGDLKSALTLLEGGVEVMKRTQTMHMASVMASTLALWRGLAGDESASDGVERAIASYQNEHDALISSINQLRLGQVLLLRGRPAPALEALSRAQDIWDREGVIQDYPAPIFYTLVRAGLIAREQSLPIEESELRRAMRRARRLAGQHPNFQVPTLATEALLLWERGARAKARKAGDACLRLADRQGARLFAAEARLELGRRYLCSPADRSIGREYLEAARSELAACGAHLLAARAAEAGAMAG